MEIPEILNRKAQELEAYYREHCPEAVPLVKNCFLNTIETTVKKTGDDYFVITGDIPAMWLRDSTAQLMHYVRYAGEDENLQEIIEGVIRRQARMVLTDPYANAFNERPDGSCYARDLTDMGPYIWERKYEVDSLCAPVYLVYRYWKATGKTELFDGQIHEMLLQIRAVFGREQNHGESAYTFERKDCVETDTLPCNGKGNPTGYTGMTWSGFRPSDDRCIYGYLIPSQIMAVKALEYAREIFFTIYKDEEQAESCGKLAGEIEEGIRTYGITERKPYGRIYAYETDGLGNYVFMDDANCPSLLSLPYLGYCEADEEIYRNTRAYILSEDNPCYFRGRVLRGVGSPHTKKGNVWPIGIVMQALTSGDKEEIKECMQMLLASHAGTNYMHESINAEDPQDYTRSWFAWANSLFAELLIRGKEQGIWEEVPQSGACKEAAGTL